MTANEALRAEKISVRFGGVHAVQDVSLEAPLGRLTALIGPNGAGKTTTFNALCGLNKPSGGTITLFGEDIGHLTPPARAQRGLGRTFQRMELFDSLTVVDNVALGVEAGMAGSRPLRHLLTSKSERNRIREATDEAIELCGLAPLASRRAGAISTGQRRLVELARAIAGQFKVLLLDEPSSGLDGHETKRFGQILREIIARRGTGILLVEHDMSLVMDVCDYIYVIDFGLPIFEGTPPEVRTSEVVRAAYLGSEAVEAEVG
ncbi:MAG: ABC transporter ATP-binding protein [Actinomycetota bacterium]|jgi:ABC-type branched-subunit amino acid transport system ATPase component